MTRLVYWGMEYIIGVVILVAIIWIVRKRSTAEEEGLQYPLDAPGRSAGELYINYEAEESDDDDYMNQVMSSDS